MTRLYLFEDFNDVSDKLTEKIISVLPEGCRRRASRYTQEWDRRNSACAYMLLVYALRESFGIKSFDIEIAEHGKPCLKECDDVYFNISHCRDGCVCAVSDKEIGIDIQEIRPYSQRLAERVCCENELKLIENSDNKAAEFTKIWAMKESFIKMNGQGFSYTLKKADTTEMNFIKAIRRENCFIAVACRTD